MWRDQVVRCQDDLDFSDILVEYNGHPGPGGFTIYDEEKGKSTC